MPSACSPSWRSTRGPMVRAHVAGTLWCDTSECKANANLRSAVWRIERLGHGLLEASRTHLHLSSSVGVDVAEATALARHLACPETAPVPAPNLHMTFSSGDLLPDWYDDADWIRLERTRFHQLRLHTLERLCSILITHGRIDEAVDAGLAAVAADPLRESAHRAVISAYLAEGNTIEAIRQYDAFRKLVNEEMGTIPTSQMEALMVGAW